MMTAAQLDFQVRPNLQRTLQYRPHIKMVYHMLRICAIVWAFPPYSYVAYRLVGGETHNAMTILAMGSFFPALFLLQAYFLIRPMVYTRVHLRPDGMTLEARGSSKDISFEKVKKIEFSHISYLGGWFTLTLNGREKYKISMMLERSEYILESLAHLNPKLISAEKFMSYRENAIVNDQGWSRTYDMFSQWKKIVSFYLTTTLVMVAPIYAFDPMRSENPIQLFWTMLLINICVGFCKWQLNQGLQAMRVKKEMRINPLHTRRDLAYEKKSNIWFFRAHLVVLGVIMVSLI